jgi:alpha-L-rhamnosidase
MTMVAAPTHLTVETLAQPLAVPTGRPRFGWRVAAVGVHARQAAYELEVLEPGSRKPIARSGRVESAQSAFVQLAEIELPPRSTFLWRVRVWLQGAGPSDWAESSFGTALLHPAEEWSAPWIEPQQEPVTREAEIDAAASATGAYPHTPPEARLHPAPLVHQRFHLVRLPEAARLYITAHGLYEVQLNGRVVGDEVFAPGYDAHPRRLSVHTHDVTELLRPGENVIGVTLADGWWAGRTSFAGASANYGDRLGVSWQLEGDRQVIAVSDATAVCALGPIRYADIFIGEKHDAREARPGWSEPGFDAGDWLPVTDRGRNVDGLVPFIGEPVRRVAEIRPRAILRTPAGETVIDLGQNIAGRLRLRARGPRGAAIRLEHSETLDRDGAFLNNIMGRNKDQTDVWILAGEGEEVFEPAFTFHGFRYVRVTGYPGELTVDDVVGVVIASDLAQTGAFETDDRRVNRLHQNVVWSQRGNFLSIPTDCPQRERAGWTGDIQVFAPAAANNMHVHPFLRRWLANVRAAQLENGQVPLIVPNTPSFVRMMPFATQSAAGWSDAIALVPWTLFERYGDRQVLEENYAAMLAWHGYVEGVARAGVPDRYQGEPEASPVRTRQPYLWNTGFQFGDWLTPSTLGGGPMDVWNAPRLTGELVGSAFYYRTTLAVLRAAELVGDVPTARRLEALAPRIRQAFCDEFISPDGRMSVELQGAYVLALAFGLPPEPLRAAVGEQLAALVERAGRRLDAGFLSLPFLLDVLVDIGRKDLAYAILLQDEAPSWLYQVGHGATTIWEEWAAIDADGQPHAMSFNHYALGAVDDWLFRHVAGIKALSPGYGDLLIEPDLDSPFSWIRAHLATPYGPVGVELERRRGPCRLTIDAPANVSASLRLPGRSAALRPGRQVFDL